MATPCETLFGKELNNADMGVFWFSGLVHIHECQKWEIMDIRSEVVLCMGNLDFMNRIYFQKHETLVLEKYGQCDKYNFPLFPGPFYSLYIDKRHTVREPAAELMTSSSTVPRMSQNDYEGHI